MSRGNPPGGIRINPQPNVYTVLALIGALATLGALIFVLIQYQALVGF